MSIPTEMELFEISRVPIIYGKAKKWAGFKPSK